MTRVFLIDDDQDDKELFELALGTLAKPIHFDYAEDGEEALALIAKGNYTRPDYIFVDMNMPRINGYQFIAALREKDLLADVPVFIYTTSSTGPDIDRCLKLGAQLFTKHSSFHELCSGLLSKIV